MSYIVYETISRTITSAYKSLEDAVKAAALDEDLSSDDSDRRVPRSYSGAGEWFFHADGTITRVPPRRSSEVLISAAEDTVLQISFWRAGGFAFAESFPANKLQSGLDWLYWGTVGVNRVIRSNHWTLQQKLPFLLATALGAAGISTPPQFLAAVPAVTPTSAVLWINPNDGTPWTLADSIANTALEANAITTNWASAPSDTDMVGNAWIYTL